MQLEVLVSIHVEDEVEGAALAPDAITIIRDAINEQLMTLLVGNKSVVITANLWED